jgi:Polysaccharide deacetylase
VSGTAEATLLGNAHVAIATTTTANARTTANLNPRLSGARAMSTPSCHRIDARDARGRNRERCVNCFTLGIIIILMETINDTYIGAPTPARGQMARAYPSMVRRVYDEGHTVANHTQNHPIRKMSATQAAREIEEGFASLREAIGDPQAVSPFFRIPGLLRQKSVEQYLAAHGDMTWSADFLADDWTRIKDSEVARRAISRIEARGKGILLLHDIHARIVPALPEILNELKSRGYKIVHVVPAAADRPKTATSAEQWVARPTPEQHPSPSQMRPLRRPPKRGLRTLHDVRFR